MRPIIIEACVESMEQCLHAEKKGANRIELCADLIHDGLTPDIDLIRQAKEHVKIPIRVMIRPRAGDFVYTEEEFTQMKKSISGCSEIGVEGVVFGICTADRELDIDRIAILVSEARPLKVTIHKAIDRCENPLEELKKLNSLGIDSILSSGKAATAKAGAAMLREMVQNSGAIEVIACGKVTDKNLDEVDQLILAPAYHGKKIVGNL